MYETPPLIDINIYDNLLMYYWTDYIWPRIEPVFWVLNIIGLLVVAFMFYKYWSARKELERLKSEIKALHEAKFEWVKTKPAKNPRWERIEKLSLSSNPSDWRVAILEADSILDELIIQLGYIGADMGERMRSIDATKFPYLDEAWKVHKLRNVIAHEAAYDLQRGETEDAIDAYNLIFKALGYLQ